MDALFSQLDELIPTLLADYGVPGIGIALVKDDQVVYARGFGVREAGRPEPVDEHSIFGIGSCTKAFTATAVGMLVQAGELSWDDPVTRYLPHFQLYDPLATREITIRDLLCHRSGLPTFGGDFMFYASRYSDEEVLERVRYIPPAFRLRTGYGYANLMFMTAGLVIEKVSGLRWEAFVQHRLLQPLGMERTFTNAGRLEGIDNLAQPHQLYNHALVKVPYVVFHNGAAAGSILSSPLDMASWLRFQLNQGRVGEVQWVDPAILEETRTPQVLMSIPAAVRALFPRRHFAAYGLGWRLDDYGGRLVCTHTGGVDGMAALASFLPEERFGLVILSNRIPHFANETIYRTVLDGLLGFHDRDWRTVFLEEFHKDAQRAAENRKKLEQARPLGTRPSLPLSAYAGKYTNPIYGALTISLEEDRLVIDLDAHPQARSTLEHWHTDTFFCRWTFSSLDESFIPFRIGLHGQVESLVIKVADFVDPLEYEFKRDW